MPCIDKSYSNAMILQLVKMLKKWENKMRTFAFLGLCLIPAFAFACDNKDREVDLQTDPFHRMVTPASTTPSVDFSELETELINSSKLSQLTQLKQTTKKVRLLGHIDGILDKLSPFSQILSLDLSDTNDFSDKHVDIIAQMSQLRELNLSTRNISNEGTQKLSTLRNLVKLDLSKTGCDSGGLEFLIDLNDLKSVNLSHLALRSSFLRQLRDKNVEVLTNNSIILE
jgi:hypothetical protein